MQLSFKNNIMSAFGNHIRVLQTLHGHRSDITTCDSAPDFTLVTGSSDRTIRVWDWIIGTGYCERSNSPLTFHRYQVTCVRVSPQGSLLASASVDGTAILWNMHTLEKLSTMAQVNGDAIRTCEFSPDSTLLATAGDSGAICLWNLIHNTLVRTLLGHDGTVSTLAFTPDSQYLFSGCSLEFIIVWSMAQLLDTTQSDHECPPLCKVQNSHDLGVLCICSSSVISQEATQPVVMKYWIASSGNNNNIKLWNLIVKYHALKPKTCLPIQKQVTLKLLRTIDGHTSSVTCVRFTRNGQYLVSSSLDKVIKIWSLQGECVISLEGHRRYVNCLTISREDLLMFSGANDKLILVWCLSEAVTFDTKLFKGKNMSGEWSMASSHIKNGVSLIEKLDDIADGAINCCAFNAENILATASGDKLIRLFRVSDETNNNYSIEELSRSPLDAHTYAVNYVEFGRDGDLLLSGSLDGFVYIWSTKTAEKLFSLPLNTLSIKVCRFSWKSDLIATAGDDEIICIWSINEERYTKLATLEGHCDAVTGVSFSPDGVILVSTSFNGDFRVWNLKQQFCHIYTEEIAHDNGVLCCDFSQSLEPIPVPCEYQNYLLATSGNDGLVQLWRFTMNFNSSKQSISTDNCGTSSSTYTLGVGIWRTLQGHGSSVTFVRFAPRTGEFLASTSTDRQARVWCVYSGQCICVLDHDSIVTSCAFTENSVLLATACQDKSLWLWKMPQDLIFRTIVTSKLSIRPKPIIDWNENDTVKWLRSVNLPKAVCENAIKLSITGERLLSLNETQLIVMLQLAQDQIGIFQEAIQWLKCEELNRLSSTISLKSIEIPDDLLCPITHEVMKEPVTCNDGFTYERKAILEWFLSGKCTSPLTNEKLETMEYYINYSVRSNVISFLNKVEHMTG